MRLFDDLDDFGSFDDAVSGDVRDPCAELAGHAVPVGSTVMPNPRLDPDGHDPHIRGQVFRSPTSLPVLIDPAAA